MAIVKIITHGKSMAGTRNVLNYILDEKKTEPDLCGTLGDMPVGAPTPKEAYQEFQRVRKLYGKDNGTSIRTYTHGTISWASGEISPEEALAFAQEYLSRVYKQQQIVLAVHTDTSHIHVHFVLNPVNYLNGSMLHWSKRDLAQAKQVCDEMCRSRGLSVPVKGHHQDGTPIDQGEVTTGDRSKYQQLVRNPKQSYLVDAALAVTEALAQSASQEDFCQRMEHEHGWQVIWQDSKKHITFIDSEGHRVRDTNLSKTFHLNISKESMLQELEKNRLQKRQLSRRPKRRCHGR